MIRLFGVVAAALLLAGCDFGTPPESGNKDPDPRSNTTSVGEVVLGMGEEVFIPALGRRLRLLDIPEDSRCPIDAICVWEGNAKVSLRVSGGQAPGVDFALNTSRSIGPGEVVLNGVQLVLVSVLPAPRAGVPIPKEAYAVTIDIRVAPIR